MAASSCDVCPLFSEEALIGKPVLLPVDNLCRLIVACDDLDLCPLLDAQPFQRAPAGLRPWLLRLAIARSCASAQDGQKRMSSDKVALRGAVDLAPTAETNRQEAAASTMRIMSAAPQPPAPSPHRLARTPRSCRGGSACRRCRRFPPAGIPCGMGRW